MLHAMWHATLRATWHVAFRVSRFMLRAQVGDVSSGGKTPRNFCIVRSAPRLHVCKCEAYLSHGIEATGLRRWGCYRGGKCAWRGVCETVSALMPDSELPAWCECVRARGGVHVWVCVLTLACVCVCHNCSTDSGSIDDCHASLRGGRIVQRCCAQSRGG